MAVRHRLTILQLGRCAFLIVALRGRPQGEHFVNNLVWELARGVLWVAGAIAEGDARLLLWALAVLLAYAGGWVQHWLPGRGASAMALTRFLTATWPDAGRPAIRWGERFYTEVLDFTVKTNAPYGPTERWLTVVSPEEPEGVERVLHLADDAARAFQKASREVGRPVISLSTEDCQRDAERLKAGGAVFVKEPGRMDYGGMDAVSTTPAAA